MYDDGTHGDAVAGDGIFTVVLTFNEPAPFPVVLRVSAAFKGRLTRVFSNPFNLNVVGEAAPGIIITSPSNLSYFNSSPVTVHGTVTDTGAIVSVNGVAAPVSGEAFTVSIPLLEGPNTIAAVARNSQGASSTATIQVSLDTTPPRITIDSPFDGYVTSEASITVTGKANDIVLGTVNNQQVQVTVNGVTAAVSNRSFQALSVPLAVGNNTVVATGVDRAGNSGEFSITVTRIQTTQPHIRVVSGNNQTGPVSAALGQPPIVQVLDGLGSPIPSQTVIFAVTQNNGLLNGSAGPKSILTDSNGRAQVAWTLGSRAGSGNNLMEASVAGIPGSAIFTATGVAGTATKIVVDSGGQQTGSTGQAVPNPLVVVVTDNAHNRLASVPVTFQVVNGGGSFAGKQNVVVNTDSDGRALAILTLGPHDGIANNLVQATFPGNKGFPAAFSLTGRTPGDPAATLIKGVVLDNSNNPVPGATIRAYLQNVPAQVASGLPPSATATSDAQGQFFIEPAPVGFVKLLVDGSTIQRSGKWPNLEYELVTVPGQINTLGQPIYLLPIDTQHQACISETVGGTVTLPQVPGFALTILPGSATFPGGSKTGCVSVTPVHPDKIPMVPGFGQQPKFIVTIQPAGTLFNPPAQISIPNSEALTPGEITEMYGFDHDLGMFVSIGTGTTGADGTVIKSDRGVGVVKAGWFCGGPPADAGGAGDCPQCKTCNGTDCVPDATQECSTCTTASKPGQCDGQGTCVPGPPPTGRIVITPDQTCAGAPTIAITKHAQLNSIVSDLRAVPSCPSKFPELRWTLSDGSPTSSTSESVDWTAPDKAESVTVTLEGTDLSGNYVKLDSDIIFAVIPSTDTSSAPTSAACPAGQFGRIESYSAVAKFDSCHVDFSGLTVNEASPQIKVTMDTCKFGIGNKSGGPALTIDATNTYCCDNLTWCRKDDITIPASGCIWENQTQWQFGPNRENYVIHTNSFFIPPGNSKTKPPGGFNYLTTSRTP